MKRLLLLCCAIAAAATVFAVTRTAADEFYQFTLDAEITADAGEVVIEPRSRVLADDRFGYEIDFKALRRGTATEGDKVTSAFRRTEHWASSVNYRLEEDALDGKSDLRLAMQYDRLHFLLDDGKGRYSGYIGPEEGGNRSAFHEVMPDGKRNEVTNIPGWPGINARTINTTRETQNRVGAAAVWFSISEESRLYNEAYFADYSAPAQANYMGRFQDPVHLTLGLFPQFNADAKLKIGETMVVRRRMPVGVTPGATIDYDVSYKLERLYGTVEEPTAARFSFDATPASREHAAKADGLDVTFNAPDILGGELLLDLRKGIPVHVRWSYTVKGSIRGEAPYAAEFENEVDFTASLRANRAGDAD